MNASKINKNCNNVNHLMFYDGKKQGCQLMKLFPLKEWLSVCKLGCVTQSFGLQGTQEVILSELPHQLACGSLSCGRHGFEPRPTLLLLSVLFHLAPQICQVLPRVNSPRKRHSNLMCFTAPFLYKLFLPLLMKAASLLLLYFDPLHCPRVCVKN